ncbi:MAG: ORF6N domain-containing protein [Bacteroidia bacterium]
MEMYFDENLLVNKIYLVRGLKVMLDEDLAELYDIPTKRLNEQVKRNLDRFPSDFMFQLTELELLNLRSQIATSSLEALKSEVEIEFAMAMNSKIRGGRRYLAFAFTEHGVLMLSSVLSSKIAIQVNIRIMRVYVRLREVLNVHQELSAKIDALEAKVEKNNADVTLVFQALRQLMEPSEVKERNRIGYKRESQEPKGSLLAP